MISHHGWPETGISGPGFHPNMRFSRQTKASARPVLARAVMDLSQSEAEEHWYEGQCRGATNTEETTSAVLLMLTTGAVPRPGPGAP